MGTGAIAVVSDAGPLIHLAEIDALHLLSIFARLHIPQAVWLEITERERISTSAWLN